jgi:hypothetical protein
MRMKLEPAKLFIDGIPHQVFDGFIEVGQDWNGWSCPWFTKEVCEQILEIFMYHWEYDESNDTFYYSDLYYDTTDRCVGEQLDDFNETLYPLGNREWIWVEQENDENW